MKKEVEKEKIKPKITHYLKNGEVRDSMEGYPVPVNEHTKLFYNMMAAVVIPEDKTV